MAVKIYFVLVLVLVSSCSVPSNSSSQTTRVAISVPAREATLQNREACKAFSKSENSDQAENVSLSVRYYEELAGNSSGVLSDTFLLYVTKSKELAPYYEANQIPPKEGLSNRAGTLYLLGQLCANLLNSLTTETSEPSAQSTVPNKQVDRDVGANLIPETFLPYRTERNQYWNAVCPKNLRLNNSLPLVYCDMGEGVRHIQRLLGVNADSYFGNTVFNAVVDFQFENGLPVTGDIDEQTWRLIDVYQTGAGRDLNEDGLITPNEFYLSR